MKERMIFDFTDMYEQITGLALTEEQLEELEERQLRNEVNMQTLNQLKKDIEETVNVPDRPQALNPSGLA